MSLSTDEFQLNSKVHIYLSAFINASICMNAHLQSHMSVKKTYIRVFTTFITLKSILGKIGSLRKNCITSIFSNEQKLRNP